MDYVADTHALVWYLSGVKTLSKIAKTALLECENGRARLIVPRSQKIQK